MKSSEVYPDLQIFTRRGRSQTSISLTFELKARNPNLGLDYERFGPITFKSDPRVHFDEFFEELGDLAQDEPSTAERKLSSHAANLTKSLLPVDLIDCLWRLSGRAKTLLVISEDPWIPWECMKLMKIGKESSNTGPFLCDTFILSRWWPHILPPPLYLPLSDIAITIPASGTLSAAAGESDFLKNLQGGKRNVTRLRPDFKTVSSELSKGKFDGWHFSGHGAAFSADPNLWKISLDDTQLTPAELCGEPGHFGARRPLVFLNSCHIGKSGMSLTQAGGWAAQLLQAGAGAFLGALYAASDIPAARFSKLFYNYFVNGRSIAESVCDARREVRREFPGDPTWISYVLYAHPRASCAEAPLTSTKEPLDTMFPTSRYRLLRRIRLAAGVALSLLIISILVLKDIRSHISRHYNDMGTEQQLKGNISRAQSSYEVARRIDPQNAAALYNLASLLEISNSDKAINFYRLALEANPNFPEAVNNLARLLVLRTDDPLGALELLQFGLANSPRADTRYALLKNLAWANLRLGNINQAEAYLQKAISLKPEGAAAHCLYALFLETEELNSEQSKICSAWEDCSRYYPGQEDEVVAMWINNAQEYLASGVCQ